MITLQQCDATRELARAITSALGPAAALAELMDAAHRLRDRADLLRSRLQFFLSHEARLEELAKRSYWHVHGFAKVRLLERDGYSLRMHVWPAGENRIGDTAPHSHRWDFASWIASGPGLSERYWVPTDERDPQGAPHFEYRYGQIDAGAGRLRALNIAMLRPDAHWNRDFGTIYGCSREVVHTVTPASAELVVTIILQGPERAASTIVYRPAGRVCTNRQRPITPVELRSLFIKVDAAMASRAVL